MTDSHKPQKRIACSTCGQLHPVVWDGSVVYFDCVPSHISIEELISALEKAGCEPRPVQQQ